MPALFTVACRPLVCKNNPSRSLQITLKSLVLFAVVTALPPRLLADTSFRADTVSSFVMGMHTGALVVQDLNADGNPDVIVPDSAAGRVSVFLNEGSGRFAQARNSPYLLSAAPVALLVNDFNADGRPDLAVLDTRGTLQLFLNNGRGEFVATLDATSVGARMIAMASGDFNRDGHPDLAIAGADGHLAILLGDGRGGFTPAANQLALSASSEVRITIADFNRDGYVDLAVNGGTGISLYWGDGAGGFTAGPQLPSPPSCKTAAMAVGDFDGDGRTDLAALCAGASKVLLFLRSHDGTFPPVEVDLPAQPAALAAGDANGDGRDELIVAAPSGGIFTISLNDRASFVVEPAIGIAPALQPYLLGVADFDNDGRPDLILAGRRDDQILVALNSLPRLSVAPRSVSLQVDSAGANSDPAGLFVSAAPGPYAPLTIDAMQSWLEVTPATGATNGDSRVNVRAVSSKLEPGDYQGSARVTAPGYFGTSLSVALHVGAPVGVPPGEEATPSAARINPAARRRQTIAFRPVRTGGAGAAPMLATSPSASSHLTAAAVLPPGQSITFSQPTNMQIGQTLVLNAYSTSGLPITFTSLTPAICSINPSDGHTLAVTAVGICSVTASQAGGYSINVTSTTVSQCTIPFQAASQTSVAVTFGLSVNSGSSGCSVAASTILFSAAPSVTRSFQVLTAWSALPQAVVAQSLVSIPYSSTPILLSASASSTLPVTFDTTTPAICSVTGTALNTLGEGICTIVASQGGDASWQPASTSQSFVVSSNPAGTLIAAPAGPTAVPKAPYSGAAADFNGDGQTDLVAVNRQDNSLVIALGNGAGSFTPGTAVATGLAPAGVAIHDFNGDGNLDVAVANQGGNTVSILLGDGAGHLAASSTIAVGTGPTSIALGDFNGDGFIDLAVLNAGSNNVTILLADGRGGFAPSSPGSIAVEPLSSAIVAGDFSGAGGFDLAVASRSGNDITLLLSDGTGGFQASPNGPVPAGQSPSSLAIGDFNNDSLLDLAVADSAGNTVTVLLNNGSGGFTAPAGGPIPAGTTPIAVVAGDFDGNGNFDLAVLNQGSKNLTLLLGNGAGGFAPAPGTPIALGTDPQGIVIGDFSDDGEVDLAVLGGAGRTISALLAGCSSTSASLSISTPPPLTVGQQMQITAAVTGNAGGWALPTGTTTLYDNGTPVATSLQTASPYSFTASPLRGSHSFTVTYNGDPRNGAATSSPLTVQVSGLTQTITFPALPDSTYGQPGPALTATASSGLAVTYAASPGTVCTVSGITITKVGTGTCSITANQAGNTTYNPAAAVVRSFNIGPGTQSITFALVAQVPYGNLPLPISATASSLLPVSFASNTPAVCTFFGSLVTILHTGTCSITATQSGNANYLAAPSVTRQLLVVKGAPALTWSQPAPIATGTALGASQLNATAAVPGVFTYTPAAGTVLSLGSGQLLSVIFRPTDTVNYAATRAAVAIDVLATATGAAAPTNVLFRASLDRDSSGAVVATVIMTNDSNVARTVAIKSATIGNTSGTPGSLFIGSIHPGASVKATIVFPASVGVSGTADTLILVGMSNTGSFSSSTQIVLP